MIKEEEIRSEILDYLLKNPDAGGTLEDISKWWLELERVNQAVDEVAQALERLIKNGIVKRIVEGGSPIYKINKYHISLMIK